MNRQEEVLRRLAAGELTRERPRKLWGGLGNGLPCAGCGEPILAADVEYEYVFATGPAVSFHRLCAITWENACGC
jgi:hypothetical protein